MVNDVTGRGRQTSTSAIVLELPAHQIDGVDLEPGWVIDTPGVRSFGLSHVTRENIVAAFGDLDVADRGLPARLHPRDRGAGLRARRGGRPRRAAARAAGVVPPDARLRPVGFVPCLPPRTEDPLLRGLTDDLRLAHLLADDADSITMSRFKALDLQVTAKPDLSPVTDADTAVEESLRRTLGRARPARRGARRGDVRHRLGPAALGDRPDRRHQELRPRRARSGPP